MQAPASRLGVLGIAPSSERVYRTLLRNPGHTLAELAEAAGRAPEQLTDDLAGLVARRLVVVSDGRVRAEPPDVALNRLLTQESRRLADADDALKAARAEVASYVAEHLAGDKGSWQHLTIDLLPADEVVGVIETLIDSGEGELLFLRPDQWNLPVGIGIDAHVAEAVARGRASRALYPTSIMSSRTKTIDQRARAGERIRCLPVLATRMAVFGTDAVVLPEHWGGSDAARLVVREPAIVRACIAYFEELWARAVDIPGMSRSDPYRSSRGQTLALLAQGGKDEQIARALGLSLRTVRRRVAGIMVELGVDTRFQAGMEAVRRGWL